MKLFLDTLNQMGELLLIMIVGFVLVKLKAVPDSVTQVLSKLENNVFIPALVMGTFMENLTPAKLGVYGKLLALGCIVVVLTVPMAILVAKCFSKNRYLRNIYTYGLAFSNFGFMGNAVVGALFATLLDGYMIFVLPFWAAIYLWGVPALLIPHEGKPKGIWQRLKPFANPMFAAMVVGILLGLSGLWIPPFVGSAVSRLGDCMSPVAMLMTGMTIAKIDLKKAISNVPVYIASVIRLVVIPLAALAVVYLVKLERDLALCVVCCLAMPLGLSPVVVPAGYGMDTSDAAGMALISHLLSCATIPLVFWLFTALIP